MVPLRANNSATEIGRVLSSDGLIVSHLSIAQIPVGFTIEPTQDDALAQRPGADVDRFQ
jgi:hypothetical protein